MEDEFKIKLLLNHWDTVGHVSLRVYGQRGYAALNILTGPKPPRYVLLQHVRLQGAIIGSARSIHHTISNLVRGNKGEKLRARKRVMADRIGMLCD